MPNQQTLVEIMKLAKKRPKEAQEAILLFVSQTFKDLQIKKIKINTSAVSLNSVNGFLTTKDDKEYFFKFHTEEGETTTMKDEYYNSDILSESGLPVIKPLFQNTKAGEQFLIYKKIDAPTAFDEFLKLDEKYNQDKANNLLKAEEKLLKTQLKTYINSLEETETEEVKNATLYQLFTKRLISENGTKPRIEDYYQNQKIELPNGETINFEDLKTYKWKINGIEYNQTLEEIIEEAKTILTPPPDQKIPTVIGHGDDHNGNKFFIDDEFVFFDPAFAGRQPALLSFIKATAHNTFLHPFWLYSLNKSTIKKGTDAWKEYEQRESELEIDFEVKNETIEITHNHPFPEKSKIRQDILDLQTQTIWKPLIKEMKEKNILPDNYKDYIQKALFCCPFLVYNLISNGNYNPKSALLNLSKCIETGSTTNQENYINKFLNSLNYPISKTKS